MKLDTSTLQEPGPEQARAISLEETGRLDEALELWNVCAVRQADSYPVRLGRGRTLCHRGDFDDAQTELKSAIVLNPEGADAHYYLSRCLYMTGDLEAARAHYLTAVQLDPVLDVPLARKQLFGPAVSSAQVEPDPRPMLFPTGSVTLSELAAPKTAPSGIALDVLHRPPPLTEVGPRRFAGSRFEGPGMQAIKGLAPVIMALEARILAPFRLAANKVPPGPHLAASARPKIMGALLFGPPSCGKAFLVRSLTGELGAILLELDARGLGTATDRRAVRQTIEECVQKAHHLSTPLVVSLASLEALHPVTGEAGERVPGLPHLLSFLAPLRRCNQPSLLVTQTDAPWLVHPSLSASVLTRTAILVEPPDRMARRFLFRSALANALPNEDELRILDATEGFTVADIHQAVHLTAGLLSHQTPRDTDLTTFLEEDRLSIGRVSIEDLMEGICRIEPSSEDWFEDAVTSRMDRRYPQYAPVLRRRRPQAPLSRHRHRDRRLE